MITFHAIQPYVLEKYMTSCTSLFTILLKGFSSVGFINLLLHVLEKYMTSCMGLIITDKNIYYTTPFQQMILLS